MVTKDFEELLALFNRHEVKALVVGAHAVAFHAKPRYTKDIDIFLEASPDNSTRVMQALAEFGFGDVGLAAADFSAPGKTIQLGVEPNRVDLLTVIDAVSFDEAWLGRAAGTYGAQPVFYLGRAELVRNKRASGRTQDQLDLEFLGEA